MDVGNRLQGSVKDGKECIANSSVDRRGHSQFCVSHFVRSKLRALPYCVIEALNALFLGIVGTCQHKEGGGGVAAAGCVFFTLSVP